MAERPELRKMPYDVPEGYFDRFKMQMRPYRTQRTWRRALPYASAAAALLFLFTVGTVLFQHPANTDEFTQEDFLVFSRDMANTEYYEYTAQYADAEIADEDIIEYLIYSGISLEEIGQYR